MAMTKTKMEVYRTGFSSEWLKSHPEDAYHCEVRLADGTNHHGRAATPHKAALRAVLHWNEYEEKRVAEAEGLENEALVRKYAQSAPGEFVDVTKPY